MTRAGRAVAALSAAVLLAGCSGGGPEPKPLAPDSSAASSASGSAPASEPATGSAAADVPVELRRFYEQDLVWESCRDGASCADVEVPLDYEKPGGRTIEIAIIRVPAEEQDDKVGALLVNPGGPGASGIGYAASASLYFREPILKHFDIVGFDPRGVGESEPIDCLSDEELDAFVAADPDPDESFERAESNALMRQFGEGCLALSGGLARHVSTVEAARDLDVIRAALAQPRMLYFGASYGTFLGATYADLFPDKVGRMVFDGAIDPTVSFLEFNLTQAKSFETAVRAYVKHCVESDECVLQGTVDDGIQVLRDFLTDVDQRPLPTGTDRQLTQGLAVLGIWAPLYDRSFWSVLDVALGKALDGDGSALLQLADAYVSRGPDGYSDNSIEALYAVNCLDRDQWIDPREVPRVEEQFVREAPTFGRIMAFGMTACGSWGVHTGNRPSALVAKGSDPLLVVGTSRDPATPLVWAEGLAEQLDNAVLVRREGDGHTGYNADNDCVDEAVESYLVSGTVPEGTVDC